MDGSLPGSEVHGIFQARILEWAAISFSRGSSQATQIYNNVGKCCKEKKRMGGIDSMESMLLYRVFRKGLTIRYHLTKERVRD